MSRVVGAGLILVFLAGICQADLTFQIRACDTALEVGETQVVEIWGLLNGAQPGGDDIASWQLDVDADKHGVVQINQIDLLEPAEIDWADAFATGYTISTTEVGDIVQLRAARVGGGLPSDVGVTYTKLAEFTIEALVADTVTFTLGLMPTTLGGDFGGIDSGLNMHFGIFDAAGSDNVFVVTSAPEPCTMMLLGVAGLVRLRRRLMA
ncbi:MAG: hypothetical protein JW936_06740 [Sedimentisphaerales bacterium]|nr:hypothetical protein [Sedimentisphaerales bacterium]